MKKKRGPKYSPFSKEFYIHYKNMSEEEAIYEAKSKRPTNIEYWIKKGFDMPNAELKLKEYQSNTSKKKTKKMKSNPELYQDIYPTQLNYWLKRGYDEDEAKEKLKERQTTNSVENISKRKNCTILEAKKIREEITNKWINSLYLKTEKEIDDFNKKKIVTKDNFSTYDEWKRYCMSKANTIENFIRRYGEKLGTEKYIDYNKNQQGRYTLNWFIKKYGKDIGTKKYFKKLKKWHTKYGSVSKESKLFFIPLYKELRRMGFKKDDILFGISGSKEFTLKDNDNKIYYFDFTIIPLNIIIEYHGIGFHPNPKWFKNDLNKWNNWKHPFEKYNADIKFHIDYYKRELAEKAGFHIYEVWSDDDILNERKYIINDIKNRNY